MPPPLRWPYVSLIAPALALLFLVGAWSWKSTHASDAKSGSTVAEELVTSLGVRPPMPDATELVQAADYNPRRVELSAERLAGLQAIVDRINAELATLQDVKKQTVQSWAMTRIELGSYRLLRSGEESRPARGAILVRVSSSDGSDKEVEILPGECADVDVIVLDMDALLQRGESEIRNYIDSCAKSHEEGA